MLVTLPAVGASAVLGGVAYGKIPFYCRGEASSAFKVITDAPHMDACLSKYKQEFGGAYDVYRNHCLRVLSFARYILITESGFSDAQVQRAMPLMEVALAYHDMGLFTDLTLEYLDPSAARAERDLKDTLSADDLLLVQNIILWHHKVSPWSGADVEGNAIVNAVRKGDWIDATTCLFGGAFVRKGVSSGNIVAAHTDLPEMGFGKFLMAIMPWGSYASKLNPGLSFRRLGALSIFKF